MLAPVNWPPTLARLIFSSGRESGAVDFADRIAELKSIRAELEKQLAAFDPPMRLRTFNAQRETTEESRVHICRCIARIDELLKDYGSR